jgi:YHS domain-containing protein
MSGLVSFLLFGALFFVMMRFGCGAHVGHGGHGGHAPQRDSNSDQTVTPCTHHALDAGVDPVCGMKVEPGAGYASVYQNQTVRFCSRDCLDKFESQPQRYLGAGAMTEAMPGIPGKRSVP